MKMLLLLPLLVRTGFPSVPETVQQMQDLAPVSKQFFVTDRDHGFTRLVCLSFGVRRRLVIYIDLLDAFACAR